MAGKPGLIRSPGTTDIHITFTNTPCPPDPLTQVNGELAVPEGLGLGVELDREALEHNTLEEL